MTESQYQTLLRVVAAEIIRQRKEKEVKKENDTSVERIRQQSQSVCEYQNHRSRKRND